MGDINVEPTKVVSFGDRHYVSAGWIDLHVHCYLKVDLDLVPLAAIRAGKGYMTEQGSAEHAFNL